MQQAHRRLHSCATEGVPAVASPPLGNSLEVHLLGLEQPPHPEEHEAVAPAAVPLAAAAASGRSCVRHGQHRMTLFPTVNAPPRL